VDKFSTFFGAGDNFRTSIAMLIAQVIVHRMQKVDKLPNNVDNSKKMWKSPQTHFPLQSFPQSVWISFPHFWGNIAS